MLKLLDESGFRQLWRRWRDGDPIAGQILVEIYSGLLLLEIRTMLRAEYWLQPKCASSDILQEMWLAFIEGLPSNYQFDTPEDLMAFLKKTAENTINMQLRKYLDVEKRDVRREVSLESVCAKEGADLASPAPGPIELLIEDEEWEKLFMSLPGPYQHMLAMLREGHTYSTIAEAVNYSEKTVWRFAKRLVKHGKARSLPPGSAPLGPPKRVRKWDF